MKTTKSKMKQLGVILDLHKNGYRINRQMLQKQYGTANVQKLQKMLTAPTQSSAVSINQ